jgi:hypothetical protein
MIADLQDTKLSCVFREKRPGYGRLARGPAPENGEPGRAGLSAEAALQKAASGQTTPAPTRRTYLPGPLRVPVGFFIITSLPRDDISLPLN